jgi:hypothetical protein
VPDAELAGMAPRRTGPGELVVTHHGHVSASAAARWDHLAASYRAQHATNQRAKIDALLLETIDVLARLLISHGNGKS